MSSWIVQCYEHKGNELKITETHYPENDENMMRFLKEVVSPSGMLWQISSYGTV